jgi:hypothetical protein
MTLSIGLMCPSLADRPILKDRTQHSESEDSDSETQRDHPVGVGFLVD